MSGHAEDIINLEQAGTLQGLFRLRVRRSPVRCAYRSFDPASGGWHDTRWDEVSLAVDRWAEALAGEGLLPGDRVALSLRNSVDWVVFEQAALSLGLVVVPLYTDDRPDNIAFILNDAAVKLLLVQDAIRLRRLLPGLDEVAVLGRIIVLADAATGLEDERACYADDWLPASAPERTVHAAEPHTLATIVYTSGTTGRPKGVMLSHHNILSIAHSALTMIKVLPEDRFLSFLPLSHTLERTGGHYLPMMAGASVAYSRSIAQLADDLMRVRPTLMITVPRIFERFHDRLQQQMTTGSPLTRLLFNSAVACGWHHFEHRQGRRGWSPKLLLWPLLKRLVADKVLARLGGRLRLVVSGGAALSPTIARTFVGLGLPLLQGYGLTETSPVISCNLPDDNDPASVGVPLRGIEVKIGDNQELLVKSPGVMLGYWNNHAATDAMIDHDGWLHSGDQARVDNGHIYITGRIKDILVLSNGEKVSPGDMEQAILLEPLFEQVVIVGEGRPFLGAVIVINADLWPGLVQGYGLDPFASQVLRDPRLLKPLLKRIAERLHEFPSFAKVRRLHLTLAPWTIDNDLLTPTMKIKRNRVVEHLAAAIEELYRE